jgi:hypothetical protein
MKKSYFTAILFFISLSINAQTDAVDLEIVKKIRKEGLENSKVMDVAFYLTDGNGPRLQGSPGFMKAANYSKEKLKEYGVNSYIIRPGYDFHLYYPNEKRNIKKEEVDAFTPDMLKHSFSI